MGNCECRASGEENVPDDKGNSIHFYKTQCLTLRTQLENVKAENALMKKVHNAVKLERDSIADELFSVKSNLENITKELASIKLSDSKSTAYHILVLVTTWWRFGAVANGSILPLQLLALIAKH